MLAYKECDPVTDFAISKGKYPTVLPSRSHCNFGLILQRKFAVGLKGQSISIGKYFL